MIADLLRYILNLFKPESEDDSKDRVILFSHAIERDQLKPGDHIYVYRALGFYQHHGIYTGKPGREVIHFSGIEKKSKSTARVRVTTLDEFLGGGTLRLVAYDEDERRAYWKKRGTSHFLKSCLASSVVSTAEYYLNNPDEFGEYNVIFNNCEDFAMHCKLQERKPKATESQTSIY